jgi:hypothetical protein
MAALLTRPPSPPTQTVPGIIAFVAREFGLSAPGSRA